MTGQGRQSIVEGRHALHGEATRVLPGITQLAHWHQEQVDTATLGRHDLLDDPPDRTNVAIHVDGAGRRHPQATGELPRGHQVEDGEGQGQAGRVASNAPGVHQHVDGQVLHVLPPRLGYDPEEADRRVILPGTKGDLDDPGPPAAYRLHLEAHHVTGNLATDGSHEVHRLAYGHAVHREDHVIGGKQPGGRTADLGHAHTGRHDRFDAEVAEGDRYRRRLGHPHQPHVEDPILVAAPAAQHLVFLDEGEGPLQLRLQVLPPVDRGVLADRREVHLADRVEPLTAGDDHPVAQRLYRARSEHEVGQPEEGEE